MLIIRDEKSNNKQLINVVPPEPGILLLAMEPFTEEVECAVVVIAVVVVVIIVVVVNIVVTGVLLLDIGAFH